MTTAEQLVHPAACPECGFEAYVGYEVRGIYDGVLYWVCPACEHAWARFTGTDHLAETSSRFATEHNEKREK